MSGFNLPHEYSGKLIQLYATGNLNSKEEIKTRLVEIADFFLEHNIAVSMRDMNRRFSRVLKKNNEKLSSLLVELQAEDRIRSAHHENRAWILSKNLYVVAEDFQLSSDMPGEAVERFISELIANGVKYFQHRPVRSVLAN
jgi:hypothetical protein